MSYKGYRVVAVTPAGRQRYLEILAPYIIKNNLVDEWRLWVNTTNISDLEYIKKLNNYDTFYSKVTLEYGNPAIQVKQDQPGYSIYQYFRNCCDPDTIYIRFDDDICYVGDDAIDNILRCRVDECGYFLIFANIVNNAIISHLYQRFCYIGSQDIVTYSCTDRLGWGSGEFAELVHKSFLCRYWPTMPNWELNIYERFSINCFTFFGRDFAQFGGVVNPNEECWLTIDKPRELGRPNLICGDAIVSHFAYYTQREYLEKTDLLQRYKELSIQYNNHV
jgi:hypothetical protein